MRITQLARGHCECRTTLMKIACGEYRPNRNQQHCVTCRHGLACHVARRLKEQDRRR